MKQPKSRLNTVCLGMIGFLPLWLSLQVLILCGNKHGETVKASFKKRKLPCRVFTCPLVESEAAQSWSPAVHNAARLGAAVVVLLLLRVLVRLE